ncbi:CBS domain-containing protein [Chelativorans sp. Marseille-P2723]|uniref:CBS domain-containing protein n=1 Tax=Chelativorans sp. Marseille-P2723 TaxID=2709133 RepID=UPI0032B1F650
MKGVLGAMSLERFRRTRMVILNASSTAYQAARAMADNHIGAVLVSDQRGIAGIVTDRDLALAVLGSDLHPKTTRLRDVMSEEIAVCEMGAGVEQAAELMREHGVRRIPLVEEGRPVGLVTFDDLVVNKSVSPETLREIVAAQLEVEAPQKPAGMLHPSAGRSAQSRARALMRAKARAESSYGRMLNAVAEAAGLERDPAERALLIVSCMLCRRLAPNEAQDLIAQLPTLLQGRLDQCADGPDRAVSTKAIEDELTRSLGLASQRAGEVLQQICKAIAESVSTGQIEDIRGQLPQDMEDLFQP